MGVLYGLPFFGRNKVTSSYGYRTLSGVRSFHQGFDIVAQDDKNVHPAAEGNVVSSTIITNKSDLTWQWGNYVKVRSGDYDTFFCHLDARYVKIGDVVTPETILGVMGNTGYSFGAHTHTEIRNKGKTSSVNPGSIFGLPNMADVIWDREAMKNSIVGLLDCTKGSYRWRRGPGTNNELYRDKNGVQMYSLTGVTYRVYQTVLVDGVIWCQITPPMSCANVSVPELWVSSECGTYLEKQPEKVAVDWDSPCNEFVVSVTGADRVRLRQLCEELQLHVENLY